MTMGTAETDYNNLGPHMGVMADDLVRRLRRKAPVACGWRIECARASARGATQDRETERNEYADAR